MWSARLELERVMNLSVYRGVGRGGIGEGFRLGLEREV